MTLHLGERNLQQIPSEVSFLHSSDKRERVMPGQGAMSTTVGIPSETSFHSASQELSSTPAFVIWVSLLDTQQCYAELIRLGYRVHHSSKVTQKLPSFLYITHLIAFTIHCSTHFWIGLVTLQEPISVQHALSTLWPPSTSSLPPLYILNFPCYLVHRKQSLCVSPLILVVSDILSS